MRYGYFLALLTVTMLGVLAGISQAEPIYTPTVIADFQSDFQGTTPKTGWRYQWNSGGAIGNSANYTNMVWFGSNYQTDAAGPLPRPTVGSYDSIYGSGGHPGNGTAQGGGFDRYAIAAYTVSETQAGTYSIIGSNIARGAGGNGNRVQVFVNNGSPLLNFVVNPSASATFNTPLGDLNFGDTIYVAVGPNGDYGNDSFSAFDYSILFTPVPLAPEPSSLALGAVGMALFAGWQWRRRRRAV